MEYRGRIGLGLVAVFAAGCGPGEPPAYPTWARIDPPKAPVGAQFRSYVECADLAQKAVPEYLTRVVFTPDKRKYAIANTVAAFQAAERAASQGGGFEFQPYGPFDSHPYQAGWRLMGRVYVWRIESALREKNDALAVGLAISATKFGFGLCGGGATDAALGLVIADEARKALAPAVERLDSSQLLRLSEGIASALERKPAMETTIRNERENMLAAVQTVQELYQRNELDRLGKHLDVDGRDAVEALRALRRRDADRRPAFFQAFAAEAENEVRLCDGLARMTAKERDGQPSPKQAEDKAVRRLAKHFFRTVRPLLAMHDATVARSRLLVLEAGLMAKVKRERVAPKSLSGFPGDLARDPYTGNPLVYRASGAAFRVYSVGADFRDDGGDTDESFTTPDLTLER